MIGIFDSGIGGVTVLKELLKVLPNENYLYYSDSINNPYGDKKKEDLEKITSNIIDFLIKNNCQLIVIACNTASTLSTYLREIYPHVLIVAIEPSYKMVHDYSFNKKTLVMATSVTLQSEKFQMLYHKYDNGKTTLLPCSGLADLIEQNKESEIDKYLFDHLSKYKGVECVVLGCTHYPLIKANIENVLGKVVFYDGSIGVSLQVKRLLQENGILTKNGGKITFIDSSGDKEKEKRFFEILLEK